MNIKSIVFINDKVRIFFSLVFFKIFRATNLFFLPNLKLKKFSHNFNLGPDQVLIKTLLCGICGSDKKIVNFDFSFFSSAIFDSKGKNVKKITLGDRVILDSLIRNEKQSKAKNVFGGFSNYFVRGQDRLEVISKKLKEDHAILIEPLACAYGAIRKKEEKKKR